MQRDAMQRIRLFGLLLLIALLVCVYTLTSSGRFHVIDEVSLFAVTESLALRGEVDTNTIAWTQYVNSPGEVLGAFGPDGQVFSKKGPAPTFLAVPWYLLLHAITELNVQIGQLQSTLLWSGILTALTAALLWLTALRLGYGDRTGMILGLLFGLATIAWPYANQFFGEPLSALGLLLCLYGMLTWRQSGRWRWMLIAGVGTALTLTTVTAHAVLIAILSSWWLADWAIRRRRSAQRPGAGWGSLLAGVVAFAVPLLVAGALLMLYNFVRFGSPLETGYHFDSGEGFTTPFLTGFWGLLVSPYRGVFWHTPLFVASLMAFVPFARRQRSVAILIAALSAALIGLYSLWWMWWGGFAWGPRFLVPLTPFWVLLLAPVIESTTDTPFRWRRLHPLHWITLVLAAISVVVQLAAVSVNFVNYEIQLRDRYPTDWADPLRYGPPAQALTALLDSPVIGQFRLMQSNFIANSDLAWLWVDGTIRWLVLLIGGAAIVTLGGALILWWRAAVAPKRSSISTPTLILAILIPVFVIATWAGEVGPEPSYGQKDSGYRAILRDICQTVSATDAFVNIAPTAYQIPMNWMPGECKTDIPAYGYALDSMNRTETAPILERVLAENDRIWFVTDGVQPNDPDNTVERWLADRAFKATDTWYENLRLLQYATPVRLSGIETRAINTALLGRRAEQITITSVRTPSVAVAGKPIPIELQYRLEAPTDQDLRWFVQLLSGQNIPLAQLDSGPDDNYTTFSSRPAREILTERAGLLVPRNTPEGEYLLIAGLYNPNDEGARLITIDGPDFVSLGAVRVVKP